MSRLLTPSNLFTLALVAGALVLWGAVGVRSATAPSSSGEIALAAAPALGAADAPLEIVYFYRYDCPYCADVSAAFDGVLADRDDVSVRFAQLPTDRSETAPVAAACADAAGRFAAYHDGVRRGLVDPDRVPDACDVAAAERRVLQDYEAADALDVTVVPTLFVGTNRVNGAVGRPTLDSLITVALR